MYVCMYIYIYVCMYVCICFAYIVRTPISTKLPSQDTLWMSGHFLCPDIFYAYRHPPFNKPSNHKKLY